MVTDHRKFITKISLYSTGCLV